MSVSEVTAFEDTVSRILSPDGESTLNSVEEYTANRCNKIQCETVQWNADTTQLFKAMQCNTITMAMQRNTITVT